LTGNDTEIITMHHCRLEPELTWTNMDARQTHNVTMSYQIPKRLTTKID